MIRHCCFETKLTRGEIIVKHRLRESTHAHTYTTHTSACRSWRVCWCWCWCSWRSEDNEDDDDDDDDDNEKEGDDDDVRMGDSSSEESHSSRSLRSIELSSKYMSSTEAVGLAAAAAVVMEWMVVGT